MRCARVAAVLLAATVLLAACGSPTPTPSGADGAVTAAAGSVDGAVVAVGGAPLPGDGTGGLGAAVEVMAGAPGDADSAVCDIERRTMQTAIDAFFALNGAEPAAEQELVDAGLLREPVVSWDLSADGTIVAAPGVLCP